MKWYDVQVSMKQEWPESVISAALWSVDGDMI